MKSRYIKIFITIAALVLTDQLIKIGIHTYCTDTFINIIPYVIRFEPVQNHNLAWVFSLAEVTPPVFLMVLIDFATFGIIFMIHRYVGFFYGEQSKVFNAFRDQALAGAFCAFIDVTIWGGSIDYVGLFDWFVFDLKDVYITSSIICLMIGMIMKRNVINAKHRCKILGVARYASVFTPALSKNHPHRTT